MSSYSAAARPRRIPRQERGQRRVCSLLDAAESVIAEHGYEAATMTEIAGRAGASIGSLYQFFPSKQAIVQALRARYRAEFAERWQPVGRDADRLNLEQFTGRLIDVAILFIDEHPAFGALLDAPRSVAGAGPMAQRVAEFLTNKRPRMRADAATRIAGVAVHIVRAFNRAWLESPATERPAVKREFRAVLLCYLSGRLIPNAAGRG